MYMLNDSNQIVKKLQDLYWAVTKHAVHEQMEEDILVH